MPALAIKSSMPFSRELRLSLHLPRASSVTLDVFDVRGRHLRQLLDGNLAAGTHPVHWDGRDHAGRALGAGLYFVRLKTPSGIVTERVVRVAAR
jgi:flagellar hook assembly protein FlgD